MEMPKQIEFIQLNKNTSCLFFPYALREFAKINVQKYKFAKGYPICPGYKMKLFPRKLFLRKESHLIFEPSRTLLVQGAHSQLLSFE